MTAMRSARESGRAIGGVFAIALLLAGCSSAQMAPTADLASQGPGIGQCVEWFQRLDEVTDRFAVRDAEARPVPGFPYLRVNRLMASFRDTAQSDPAAFAAWESHLRELDSTARKYELSNLPGTAPATLGVADRNAATAKTDRCAATMMAADAADAQRRSALIENAQVPDDYADWKRAVGLYPLVKLPFFEFAKGWQEEAAAQFRNNAAAGAPTQARRYQPERGVETDATVSEIFSRLRTDRLGIPIIADRDRQALLARFAPEYEIETTGEYDRIGSLHWGSGDAPEVDPTRPAAYSRIAFTRYGKRTLVQLVYMVWFSERPDSGWLDMLSGKLDGLIFRVTLDPAGRPLVYDTIHPCGCYHMFLPTPAAQPIPAPQTRVEWAFIPKTLPAAEPQQRLVLRIESRSHYLVDVHPRVGNESEGVRYAIADDGVLRVMPTATGTKSAFGPDGIVPGTQRGERLAVWPLGIADPGAMREWGRHATALVGRRHFDDADLIERRFDVPSLSAAAGESRTAGR